MYKSIVVVLIAVLAIEAASPSEGSTYPDVFTPYATYSTPDGTWGVAVADLNNDGILDIATANRWRQNVSVLHGDGLGAFGDRLDLTVGTRPEFITSGDFDNNGLADLAVANWSDRDVSILLQQSNGAMADGGRFPVAGHPHEIIAEDLNHDGHIDLAAATGGDITVLSNNGSGDFSDRVDYPIDEVGLGLLAMDFNSDGYLDLATTLPNTGSMVNVLDGNAGGGFEPRVAYTFQANRPAHATSADFNEDGIPDLAYAGYSGSGSLVVLLGDEKVGFELAGSHTETSFPKVVASEDFDLDGHVDLALSDYSSIWLYRGAGDGTFTDGQQVSVGSTINYLVTADLNGDGGMDIVATSGDRGWGEVYVLYNLNAVPEPASVMLVGLGALLLGRRSFRR